MEVQRREFVEAPQSEVSQNAIHLKNNLLIAQASIDIFGAYLTLTQLPLSLEEKRSYYIKLENPLLTLEENMQILAKNILERVEGVKEACIAKKPEIKEMFTKWAELISKEEDKETFNQKLLENIALQTIKQLAEDLEALKPENVAHIVAKIKDGDIARKAASQVEEIAVELVA